MAITVAKNGNDDDKNGDNDDFKMMTTYNFRQGRLSHLVPSALKGEQVWETNDEYCCTILMLCCCTIGLGYIRTDHPTDRRSDRWTDRRTDGRTHALIEIEDASKNSNIS